MITILIFIGYIMAYFAVAGLSGARHHAIESSRCGSSDCWNSYWCSHCVVSVWLAGIFWPIGVPTLLGIKAGGTSRETRTKNRRTRELEEAKHKQELAKINARTLEIQEREAGIR